MNLQDKIAVFMSDTDQCVAEAKGWIQRMDEAELTRLVKYIGDKIDGTDKETQWRDYCAYLMAHLGVQMVICRIEDEHQEELNDQ